MRLRRAPAISCTRSSKRRLSSFNAWSRASRHANPASAIEANAVMATVAWRTIRDTSVAFLPVRDALHVAPTDPCAGDPLPDAVQPPQHGELAIAEVFDQGRGSEGGELARPPVDVERNLLEEQRAHREHHAEGDGKQHENPE